jgi:5-methyltetrahydropteroyltriglutamate--homocysteine methyltransferase
MVRMKSVLNTHNLGYPRIGEQRELKRATEAYWKGSLSAEALDRAGAEIRAANWLRQKEAGIDLIPSNDFSFYDQMLDMSCLLGNVPPRFDWDGGDIDLALRFKIARGVGATHDAGCSCGESPPLLPAR